jgi:glucokinase
MGEGGFVKDYTIGIDIGGTKICAGILDSEGHILSRYYSRAHTGHPPAFVMEGLEEAVQFVLAQTGIQRDSIEGIGIGCAGHINHRTGRVFTSSNLPGWEDYPLRETAKQRLNMPVVIDNDSHCAALGEYLFGAGRGTQHMCYVTFSTGYGMGVIIDGKLYRGAIGSTGEIGHTIVVPKGELCICGKRGCVMAYASGLALSRFACERVCSGEPTSLREICGVSPDYISGETIAQAARGGDRLALELIENAAYYFGISLANILELFNPEVIVIGGGLARMGTILMDPCFRAMRENTHPELRDATRFEMSQLWDDAGLIGAAALIWENQ